MKVVLVYCFTVILLLLSFRNNYGQNSIFGKDTVYFKYYRLDFNNQNKNVLHSRPIRLPGESDSVVYVQKIFINKKGYVFWQRLNYLYDTYDLQFQDLDYEGYSLVEQDIKMEIPKFKVYSNSEGFWYISTKNDTLFKASFSKKDTIKQLPFFINEGYMNYATFPFWRRISTFLGVNEEDAFVYEQDTIIIIGEREIPCYKFSSIALRYSTDYEEYCIQFSELYFEKKTHIPILRKQRIGARYEEGLGCPEFERTDCKVYRFNSIYDIHVIAPVRGNVPKELLPSK